MVLSFDDLFALRIYYLDEIEDEVEIIKILKIRLLETEMEENEVNKYLSDFYKNSGIDISETVISEINIPVSNPVNNPVNNVVYIPINQIPNIFNNVNNFNNQINNFLQTLNNLVQQDVLSNLEDVKVTVKKEELEQFTKKIVEEDEDKPCNICLCEYKKGEEKLILKCNHEFHYDCIKKWLEEYNYKCPICRTETTETTETKDIINQNDE